jgi:penicillin-binding protein 1B
MRELMGVGKTAAKQPKRDVKMRVAGKSRLARFFLGRFGRGLLIALAFFVIAGASAFTYFYAKYARVFDEKLKAGLFANSAKIFAAPESVSVGEASTPAEIAARLRRSGYSEATSNRMGYYEVRPDAIEVYPGTDSYFDQEPGVIRFHDGKIKSIVSLQDHTPRPQYQLEPPLITNLAGPSREKRRFVKFRDIPPMLVEAVTSIEDKRFFQHSGFDPLRILKAVYVDVKEGRKEQGASTLSMQLARMFWLDQGKTWSRKFPEAIITLQLEQRFSKQEIFEDYANQVDLGYRGTFNIRGFGQAAEAYLGKDLSQINLPEAAQLAGLIQRPGVFDPYRHPDRAKDRRNVVLRLMRDNGYITDRDYAVAVEAPIVVPKGQTQSLEAPYFVDLINDTLQNQFQDTDLHNTGFRVYTTLDMRLQRLASEAIRNGMDSVDQQIKKQRRFKGQKPPEAQVALIAIDPHTGEVKALAGGRNYGMSQLNRVLSLRQPGSIFKPFVYAAALNTAVEGGPRILTPSTIVTDQPTTFWIDGKPYEPSNFEHKFYGDVTLRTALAKSLNVATVKVGEIVGFDAVVDMAKRAGMNERIAATPAVALGSYDITPLEAVGAYTMFANGGTYVKPTFLRLVRSNENKQVFKNKPERREALDPRVAYLMTSMMEEVLRTGTAAGVRARFNLNFPAAGKTGTSDRDGWFAGFTSELLCVVWVGFDDAKPLDLEGAHSAAPIWAEFMKAAAQIREYRDTKQFAAPDGIVSIDIDPQSGMAATANCPQRRPEVYISGTQPVSACPLHGGGRLVTNVTGWDVAPPPSSSDTTPRVTGSGSDGQVQPSAVQRRASRQDSAPPPASVQAADKPPQEEKKPEKKSIFRRLIGVFK